MKGIILYKSKYGSTKKYADWIAEERKHNMNGELERIPLFYCRGGWDMDSMSFMDRNLCKLLRKAVAKKDPSEYEVWETALMAAGDDKCDWTDKEYIKPIIEEIGKGR